MFKFIEYRSISDMNAALIKHLYKFPHDIDLVVGIPRSGMLPANLLALYLNKPYTDVDSFLEGRVFNTGDRGKLVEKSNTGKILVVDDSTNSGESIRRTRKKLETLSRSYNFIYGVVFSSTEGSQMVDIWCEIVNQPRIFQWNIFHHSTFLPQSCMDIDGVLCMNPPVDDDGEKYIQYITHATPYFLPTVLVDTLVSCRLEKYRSQTEAWLAEHNIKYRKLIMLNLPNKEERQKWGRHGEYKGKIYKDSDNILFIESSLYEARIISRVSGKQVYCTENFEMVCDKEYFRKKGHFITIYLKKLFSKIKSIYH